MKDCDRTHADSYLGCDHELLVGGILDLYRRFPHLRRSELEPPGEPPAIPPKPRGWRALLERAKGMLS